MNKLSRILVAITAIGLVFTQFVPLWRIELSAPQYPEGLVMEIWTHKLGGDVDVVNGLNHYIGMGTMHTEDFVEFKILPYLIWFTTLFGITTALLGKRKLLYSYTVWVILFGIVAMADFYKWEYDYGHNLDPDAPIQVPGMSYQPPFIGYKQLLNFGAYSIPDIGGFLFILNALVVVGTAFLTWKGLRSKTHHIASILLMSSILLTFTGCSKSSKPINYGTDHCAFCKMTVMDQRFGGEVISVTGKAYIFDDAGCIKEFIAKQYLPKDKIHSIYLTDFETSELFIINDASLVLYIEKIKSPMGSQIAAFSNKNSLENGINTLGGELILWEDFLSNTKAPSALNIN